MRGIASRALVRAVVFGTAFALAPAALANDPKPAPAPKPGQPAPKPPPTLASDADAAAAVAKFKEDFKAKGLKGDEKLSQRNFALATVSKVHHPLVVEAIGPFTRDSDPDLRMFATSYLGDQTLFPGLAGKHVQAGWKRSAQDDLHVITAMQSIARLRYLGARDDIRAALKSQNFAVKKTAIGTIVNTGDWRLIRDVLQLVGVQVPSQEGKGVAGAPAGAEAKGEGKLSGGSEVVTEGYSWEGAEAVVDYGMADNTQENAEAEAKVKEQIAANKAAAEAAAASSNSGGGASDGGGASGTSGGGAGIGGGTGGSSVGRGGGGRSNSELIPYVLGALNKLTGQTFTGPAHFKKWWVDNAELVGEKMKKLDEKEKFQKEEAAAQAK
jgi:hypothetical protein